MSPSENHWMKRNLTDCQPTNANPKEFNRNRTRRAYQRLGFWIQQKIGVKSNKNLRNQRKRTVSKKIKPLLSPRGLYCTCLKWRNGTGEFNNRSGTIDRFPAFLFLIFSNCFSSFTSFLRGQATVGAFFFKPTLGWYQSSQFSAKSRSNSGWQRF